MAMMVLKLGKGNRITLPKALREFLGLQAGDTVKFQGCGRTVILSKERIATRKAV